MPKATKRGPSFYTASRQQRELEGPDKMRSLRINGTNAHDIMVQNNV